MIIEQHNASDLVLWFEDPAAEQVALVGGKNASLSVMIRGLGKDIRIPGGFAITAAAYNLFWTYNNLGPDIEKELVLLDQQPGIAVLQRVGMALRARVMSAQMPPELSQQITKAYEELVRRAAKKQLFVAVRSSATAEDAPGASFAGQHDSFLYIAGSAALLAAYQKALASLFNDRALVYRREKGFDHTQVKMSVGVQQMVHADAAGVLFTLDTETGHREMITINATYGIGEALVQGKVTPDEYVVHKTVLAQGGRPLVKKHCGDKRIQLIYDTRAQEITEVAVSEQQRHQFCLSDDEIFELARAGTCIENFYSQRAGTYSAQDIEWARDAGDGKLYIVQARPETVHATPALQQTVYRLTEQPSAEPLLTGQSIGQQIVSGTVRVIADSRDIQKFRPGDILVTRMTDPDWVPIMKQAGGIITDLGGRTCHAAIVSRELGVAALVGTERGTAVLKDGDEVIIDLSKGSTGYVYDGALPYEKTVFAYTDTRLESSVPIMINMADPDRACALSFLPVAGVGLARTEFIYAHLAVHPLAIVKPDDLDVATREKLSELARGYATPRKWFVETCAQYIGLIAAAFYPRPVVVRLSDLKTNEYRRLIGGSFFEPIEENPMIGFRGAARYTSERYAPAFELECEVMRIVCERMGFSNVQVMVPFIRTVDEARAVVEMLERFGVKKSGRKIIFMVEIPSNVILIDQFAELCDGFSIGSNDLTQLVLGVDRDSALLAGHYSESDPAVKKMLSLAIAGARKEGKPIGICGDAPSHDPQMAQFLIDAGISYLSLNADAVLPFLLRK